MNNPTQPLKIVIEELRRIRGYLNAGNPTRSIAVKNEYDREIFSVPSENRPGLSYDVFVDEDGEWVCTCNDFKNRRDPCKHVVEVLDRFYAGALPPPTPEMLHAAMAAAAKNGAWYQNARRFPRTPHEYDEGLAESSRDDDTIENADVRIEELLVDLAGELNRLFPPKGGDGRPSLPPGDQVLIRVLRLYHKKSIRRCKTMLERLAKEGKISFAPSRTSIIKYESHPQMLVYMREAFRIITEVFMLMETDIIADSTGISPFRISCWRLSNYGTVNLETNTQWFRMHVAVGQITKAILGFVPVENIGEGTGDSSNLEPLVRGIHARLNVLRFVIADNIYLTDECRQMCKRYGAVLIGPTKPKNFKKDGTPVDAIKDIVALKATNPELVGHLTRARNAIEGVFSQEKRDDNHVAAIGTEDERDAAKTGGSTLFISREVELWARILRYNLNVTMREENRRNRRVSYSNSVPEMIQRTYQVSYSRGTYFSRCREYSPE